MHYAASCIPPPQMRSQGSEFDLSNQQELMAAPGSGWGSAGPKRAALQCMPAFWVDFNSFCRSLQLQLLALFRLWVRAVPISRRTPRRRRLVHGIAGCLRGAPLALLLCFAATGVHGMPASASSRPFGDGTSLRTGLVIDVEDDSPERDVTMPVGLVGIWHMQVHQYQQVRPGLRLIRFVLPRKSSSSSGSRGSRLRRLTSRWSAVSPLSKYALSQRASVLLSSLSRIVLCRAIGSRCVFSSSRGMMTLGYGWSFCLH